MKLSRIIELALVHYYGAHYAKQQFLCNAVHDLVRAKMIDDRQYKQVVTAIEKVILKVYPKEQCYCMVNALQKANYIGKGQIEKHIPYITQLYVWWVFDLKRKGL